MEVYTHTVHKEYREKQTTVGHQETGERSRTRLGTMLTNGIDLHKELQRATRHKQNGNAQVWAGVHFGRHKAITTT